MRTKGNSFSLLPLLLLTGCNVPLTVKEAVAEPLGAQDLKAISDASGPPSAAGRWFKVKAVLPRETVRKIARWELYTHMLVEDCRTGELVGIASNVSIQGTEGDFRQIDEQLRTEQRKEPFTISEPVSFPAGKSLSGLCLKLEGGSYLMQKISNKPVPLKVRLPTG